MKLNTAVKSNFILFCRFKVIIREGLEVITLTTTSAVKYKFNILFSSGFINFCYFMNATFSDLNNTVGLIYETNIIEWNKLKNSRE